VPIVHQHIGRRDVIISVEQEVALDGSAFAAEALVETAATGAISVGQTVDVEIQKRVSASQTVGVGGQATADVTGTQARAKGSIGLSQDVGITIQRLVGADQSVGVSGRVSDAWRTRS